MIGSKHIVNIVKHIGSSAEVTITTSNASWELKVIPNSFDGANSSMALELIGIVGVLLLNKMPFVLS